MGPRVKKKKKQTNKKNKTKTTLAKLALYASGFVVDTSSTSQSEKSIGKTFFFVSV